MIHPHTNQADIDDRTREGVIDPTLGEAVLAIANPAGGAKMVLLTAGQIRMLHALLDEPPTESCVH